MMHYPAYRFLCILLPTLFLMIGCSGLNQTATNKPNSTQAAVKSQIQAATSKSKQYVIKHVAKKTAGIQPVPSLKLAEYKPPAVPRRPAPVVQKAVARPKPSRAITRKPEQPVRRVQLARYKPQKNVRASASHLKRKPQVTRAAHVKKPAPRKIATRHPHPAVVRAHLKAASKPALSRKPRQKRPATRPVIPRRLTQRHVKPQAQVVSRPPQTRRSPANKPIKKPAKSSQRAMPSAQVHQIGIKKKSYRKNLSALPVTPRRKVTLVDRVIHKAKKQIGRKYVWGGESPEEGFDCSGLVQHVMKAGANVKVPRTALRQYRAAQKISPAKARRGDLVFFITRGKRVSHVGIYLGDNRFLHAPRTGKRIRIEPIKGYWKRRFVGFGRIPEIWKSNTVLTKR